MSLKELFATTCFVFVTIIQCSVSAKPTTKGKKRLISPDALADKNFIVVIDFDGTLGHGYQNGESAPEGRTLFTADGLRVELRPFTIEFINIVCNQFYCVLYSAADHAYVQDVFNHLNTLTDGPLLMNFRSRTNCDYYKFGPVKSKYKKFKYIVTKDQELKTMIVDDKPEYYDPDQTNGQCYDIPEWIDDLHDSYLEDFAKYLVLHFHLNISLTTKTIPGKRSLCGRAEDTEIRVYRDAKEVWKTEEYVFQKGPHTDVDLSPFLNVQGGSSGVK